ncbi:D-2-hydroxyacid dehydrogenase family protein [Mycolicibacterium sp. 018/SC-01/001]|uniref:D-2-hydroxyacid dehydrogenase family protein n=1 Tax=Mycolicibacterium sp. 018/SC-01/001 TaxID=2592069 RepID=UPI00117CDAFB|nr:D-2-hydroxyacid dehydrogenase family protein [Mycolicibacterium sp. 018/SC-01/001]TRW87910.1 D-2-hydroxyacid dehydrogenase family protein [Mycolicibacterium sp. 018/SC-01/001]
MSTSRIRIAVLDDYQDVALSSADWSPVTARADVTTFSDHVSDEDGLVARLAEFDVVFVMRERTPLPRTVLERLPRLKMIASTGPVNASIDMAAAQELGIHVTGTGGSVASTVELTWALILATSRHLVTESRSIADGGWQTTVGRELDRRVLGVLGLGRIGSRVARIGAAFGMDVVAWSQNLTADAAAEAGVRYLPREDFFAAADVLTVHLRLSERTRGLIGAAEMAAMKPSALLINTSRGPIVDEAALIDALTSGAIAGAGLDVFDTEPLPATHPLRTLASVTATPHIGYVADRPYRIFFRDGVAAIAEWLDGRPV